MHRKEEENAKQELCDHISRLVVVEQAFSIPLQTACRNLSKDGLKIKFVDTFARNHGNERETVVEPGTGLGK